MSLRLTGTLRDALAGAEPLTHSRCYLLKLHGDYKDARILNTDQELSAYPESYDKLLDRIFDEHGLIVCGCPRAGAKRGWLMYGQLVRTPGSPTERARAISGIEKEESCVTSFAQPRSRFSPHPPRSA